MPIRVTSFDKTAVLEPIAIAPEYYINNCLKMKYSNGQLFLLDNDMLGKGRGVVQIFNIALEDSITIKWTNMLTSFTFGSPIATGITDIQIT